ncbi:MAG: TAT-variant-translocated molybdopterin oxidoreductase [Planctomycetes bacterium]|nr:TAT-variant-translocated molybdopterin oxidoreductase [Planctomycetota bacterium]
MKPDITDSAANEPAAPPDKLWRGLDEFQGAPGYAEAALNEFPEGATELDEPSRRRFLTYMGASLALAGAAGCNLRPASQRKIIPYTTQPDELTPGVPLFFASAAPFAGYGRGVLVRSNEGRPTKIEGNPDHPSSLGGTDIHAQASVLDLYDPDRSRGVTQRGTPTSYEQAVAALRGKLFTGNNNANTALRVRVLTETVTSPTFAWQIGQFLNTFPNARWVQFDAVSTENARSGVKKAFGKSLNVTYDFLKADVVLSLDSDFLCSGPGAVRYSRDFADRRKIRAEGKDRAELEAGRQAGRSFKEGVKVDPKADPKDSLINRLYAVECMPTNTGAVADHRIALTTGQIGAFVRSLAAELKVPGVTGAGSWADAQVKWLQELAKDLLAKKGKSVVVAGDHLPAWVHTLVAAINSTLGNVGQTVKLTAPVEASVEGKMSDLRTLVNELNAKTVDVLLVLGDANPAYSAPADIDFAGAMREYHKDATKFSLHLGSHQDETAVLCDWHVNEAHYLETWGDIRGHDGTVAIQQPLIAPLHGGKSAIELFTTIMRSPEASVPGAPRDPFDIVKSTWQKADEVKKTFPNFPALPKAAAFEVFWQEAVRSGVVAGTAAVEEKAPALAANWSSDLAAGTGPAVAAGELELNFRPDPTLYDGRFANNGWLQELPKPLTKISWDNAAFVSPKTAEKLGVKAEARWTGGEHGRMEVNVIELTVKVKLADGKEEDRKVRAPAWILPGHADDAVTVHLGYGRTRAGDYVANAPGEKNAAGQDGVRGFNVYPLRTGSTWAVGAKAARVGAGAKSGSGAKYFLACTQGHWAMAEKDPISGKMLDRKPVRRGSLADYAKNPRFAKIPPMAAGETELINENVPLPKKHEKKSDHDHDHSHGAGEHEHDGRLIPLNMYKPAEGLVPDLRDAQRRRWALAIDLSACTGCSACVVACQSENNTPVVGKDQVTKGREMYWINIDRYYEGLEGNDPNAVKAYFQPRMCVQCENAPCEIVCPVGATVHSADGLNDMTYNRCVGTRYCSNNCPYKVRRFNFLTLQDWETDTIKLGRNPEVSVRSRGVMEKCTFCVQRIRGAEIVAEREGRPIRDGEILTACQSACPSGAIVFGDINDADAAVSKWKNEPSNYGLLAELNTRPRLTYTAVVRNPNPAMPK